MRSRWPLVLALVVIAGVVLLWRSARDASRPPKSEEAPTSRPADTRTPAVPTVSAPTPRVFLPQRTNTFDATTRHTVDPCTAPVDAVIPPGFEKIIEGPITVAWDPKDALLAPHDTPLRPVALAHAAVGVLEEAAQLTGTDRRDNLTLIVDASADDMQRRMKTPVWVHGLYDGGAIHLPAKSNADLGVAMHTLRHEIMHAQLHAAVGCTPFWFNEGMANYFSGSIPTREWFAMVRTGEPFDLSTIHDPAILDLAKDNVTRMYAVSLAMVVYLVHRGGEQNLRATVGIARTAESHRDALELWDRIAPDAEYRDVIDSLAQSVFGVPLGPELEMIFRGPICCKRLSQPAELSCRAAAGELGIAKGYFCRTRW